MTRSQYNAMLATSMGGHVAEELAMGEMTTGPQSDIQQATRTARQMVTQWGMSERLGPRTFGRKEEMIFLGREISEQRDYSEKVAEEIDEEVRRLIDKAYQTAKELLMEHRAKLDEIVARCMDPEPELRPQSALELRRALDPIRKLYPASSGGRRDIRWAPISTRKRMRS